MADEVSPSETRGGRRPGGGHPQKRHCVGNGGRVFRGGQSSAVGAVMAVVMAVVSEAGTNPFEIPGRENEGRKGRRDGEEEGRMEEPFLAERETPWVAEESKFALLFTVPAAFLLF